MTAKERRQQKQDQRAEKLTEDILSGRAVYVPYEERMKKKAKPNRKDSAREPAEEMAGRMDLIGKASRLYRVILPGLLVKFSRIGDPRDPQKIEHKLTVLLLYGIVMFAYQIGSRREANTQLSRPIAFRNLQDVFPELESMPHADTLARLLKRIDVEEIQNCHIELLKDLMRNKKFNNQLTNGRYLVAVDASQKFARGYQWQDEALCRRVGVDKKEQYYTYVLESLLVFENGLLLPVLTEMMENKDWERGKTKQDCELKSFKRLSEGLYKIFGKGKLTLVADGLYACGPVMSICRKYEWDFMINLKEGSLPDVWEDAQGQIKGGLHHEKEVQWGERNQLYKWVNDIQYGSIKKPGTAHVVFCTETWTEKRTRSTKKEAQCMTQYAWISSRPITEGNVFSRCTQMARRRWRIENNFHVEKHDGYCYEHCYSYNWNAMKGFHYLMKIAHFINALIVNSEAVADDVVTKGITGFFSDLWLALSGAELDHSKLKAEANRKFLWRLNVTNVFQVAPSSA